MTALMTALVVHEDAAELVDGPAVPFGPWLGSRQGLVGPTELALGNP